MTVTLQPVIRHIKHGKLSLLFVVSFVVLFVTSVAGCSRQTQMQDASVTVTVAAGGMVLPTPVIVQTIAVDSALPTTGSALSGFQPGQILEAAEALLLYADANSEAAVMNRYLNPAQFTVLEPSGNYSAYPILRGDTMWYRVRAADGLVGWAKADALIP